MTKEKTSIKANEDFVNLLHEFSFHLISKMEEFAQYAILMERLLRDSGTLF